MNFAISSLLLVALTLPLAGSAQTAGSEAPASAPPSGAATSLTSVPGSTAPVTAASPQYVLRVGDVVQVKVYQEEDMTSTSRIGSDGTISMPLLGSVKVVSNTVDAASAIVRELLAKDYLVNPQVSLNVTEFAKRRFTVLGQVQRPGTFDMPTDETHFVAPGHRHGRRLHPDRESEPDHGSADGEQSQYPNQAGR